VVAHAFNPSTWEAEAGGFLSSRTARATQRNPILKKKIQSNNIEVFASCIKFLLQLESKAFNVGAGAWINSTVPVDSTVGNDTFFVITWTVRKPEIILQDPKGKNYTTSDFQEDKLNIFSVRLRIPGIAEVGLFCCFCELPIYVRK
jgi:hypothetical protein